MKTKQVLLYAFIYIALVAIAVSFVSCSTREYFNTTTTTVVKYRLVDPNTGTIYKGRQKLQTIEVKTPTDSTETASNKVTTGF